MKDTEKLQKEIEKAIEIACGYKKDSAERKRHLGRVIRLIQQTKQIWKESSRYYEDALQQTWVYFCLNLCEAITTEKPYDPKVGKVTTWINSYLKRRLQDKYSQQQQEKQQKVYETPDYNPMDFLEAPPERSSILEELSEWVKQDQTGELRNTYIKGRKDLSAQLIILRRLPPETSWSDLSEEWGVKVSTLSSFYERKCRPTLRKFGEEFGYLSQ